MMELVFSWNGVFSGRGVHVERVRLEPEVTVLIAQAIRSARWRGETHLVEVDYLDPAHMASALEVQVLPTGETWDDGEYVYEVEVVAASAHMRYVSEPLSSGKIDKVLRVADAYDIDDVIDYPEVVDEYMHKALFPQW